MFSYLLIHLALAAGFVSTAALNKRAVLNTCLQQSGVPIDAQGASNWTSDALPFNARLPYIPVAVAVPTTVAQIQSAVKCAVSAGVKTNPKCGGHSYASLGLGGEDGHLIIQLDQMYNVTLNASTNIATVQAGARLGHVTNQLWNQGKRAISAGTCPAVGVSGHALHGGYGMSSHKYGLATDWIVSMTVVLANGTVTDCSASQNSDLFWALRGAGSNFGVVALYHFNTFAAPSIVSYFNMPFTWNINNAASNLAAVENFTKTIMPAELTMRMYTSLGSSYFEGMYFGNITGLKAALQPLLARTGLSLRNPTQTDFLSAFVHYAYTSNTDVTSDSSQETFYAKSLMLKGLNGTSAKNFANYWFTTGPSNKRNWWLQLDFHGGASSAVTNGDHSLSSYAHRDKLFMIQFYDKVNSGSYPSNGFSFLDGWVNTTVQSLPSSDWGAYINYADSQLDHSTANQQYYGANLPRLQSLKAAYDPNHLFYYPQSI